MIRTDKEKADSYAEYLSDVFAPYPADTRDDIEQDVDQTLNDQDQMAPSATHFIFQEIKTIMKEINPKKTPGFDLISGKVLQELPKIGIKAIQQIYNAILRLCYFPKQWKISQIIMILKPGKNPQDLTLYRPISLLPSLSKVYEKLLLKRLQPIIDDKKLIPQHQFGFCTKHVTIEQIHRVMKQISEDFERKHYCSAAFIDISQAFDKVWHKGLCYKLKSMLPSQYYEILKSYLSDRRYFVQQHEEQTNLYKIRSGVPQGSV